jgi:hypothetical protein
MAKTEKEVPKSPVAPKSRATVTRPSAGLAFPCFDEEGIFNSGMTKAEYATIRFVAAHLQAHGTYPAAQQVDALCALAIKTLDYVIPDTEKFVYPTNAIDDHE